MIKQCRKWYIWQSLAISFLCIFSYSESLFNGFMMDDYILLPKVKSLGWGAIFTHVLNGFYRPVATGFIKLIYSILGFNSIGYHVVNLFLYIIICLLFLYISRWLFINGKAYPSDNNGLASANWASFISAVIYCVHPINNMIVNYKTASMLAVFIICMQISFITFLLYLESRKAIYYLLSIFFYLCSLFSHEMSSILPIYIFMVAYYLRGNRIKTVLILLSPYFACLIFYILVWWHFSIRAHLVRGLFGIPFEVYLATLFKLLQWYVCKLFLPRNILFLWDVPIIGDCVLACSLGFILLIGLLAGAVFVFTKFRKRFEVFSLSFFVVGFIPLCIAAFTYTSLTETALIEPHWFYFSSIGFFMLLAIFFVFLGRNLSRLSKTTALCGLVMILVVMTRQSNIIWKDNETYCKYWIESNPYNGAPDFYLQMKGFPK